jgi:AcrR family transcriptional regulator
MDVAASSERSMIQERAFVRLSPPYGLRGMATAPASAAPTLPRALQLRVLERRDRTLALSEPRRARSGASGGGTRDTVLRASVSLFAKLGFEACTMRDLATSAGIKPPALYNHFASKEQILTEAMWLAFGDFLSTVLTPLSEEAPEHWLEGIVRRHTMFQLEQQQLATANDLLMQREAIARHMPEDEHTAFLAAEREYVHIVRDLVKSASGTRSANRATVDAFAVIAMCDRVSTWYRPDGPMSTRQIVDQTWSAVSRLLARG